LKRLRHAFALRNLLDPTWAARPLALEVHQGRPVLLLEDPGGEVLERLLGHPLEIGLFLRLAIGLTVALGRLHAQGLVHKDIKPANILVQAETGSVWLTGFGVTSRLPREPQAPVAPEVVAGTFAYMAPEQTGRMNRSIDIRSDLYSLGCTLYEMLTGTLPFSASDPLEWFHCHLARQPVPPSERVTEVPEQVAAIASKLLAKSPEDRYQTAAGVEADLRRCLAGWESNDRIDPFPLGLRDTSERLLIPEKLYGREAEIGALIAAFDRVLAHGRTELVVVSGHPGIGKSSIVNELHQVLIPARGLFGSGKSGQYTREIPYSALAQAIRSLIRELLSKDDATLSTWRHALQEALGPNGQLLVNLIPELALIIGEQPPVPEVSDAQSRFQLVFRRFLGVFARPGHPLVLFLDDIQWLDTASLNVIEGLVIDPQLRHLLLIGAFRDNEVDPLHPLTRTLQAIRSSGGKVEEILVGPLRNDLVVQLFADSLHMERDAVRPLAELVAEKTGGNPFFVIQFVTTLNEEGLLVFDPHASSWKWDLDRIRVRRITDNVADLICGKLNRLPAATLEALKQFACLGKSANTTTLATVLGTSEEEVHITLWEAVRAGCIFRMDDTYVFVHDRVQEATYGLIPDAERPFVHLRIGRILASQTAPQELEANIFEIVNQLNRGAALIRSVEERDQLAELNILAGKRAKTSSAYASALKYFVSGSAMLTEDSWQRQYRLTFDLACHLAECYFLTGDLARAEELLSDLSRRTANLLDQAALTRLRVALYTTLARVDRALEIGLEYLHHVGIDWPPHSTEADVRHECQRMLQLLNGRSFDQLFNLPLMIDPECRATMDVLLELAPTAALVNSNLACLGLLRMVNLSLEYGYCDASCYAYPSVHPILMMFFGDYQTASRFGQLACDLVEKRGLDRFKSRVYTIFGALAVWTEYLPASRALLVRAIDVSNAIGDITFALYASQWLTTNLLISGEPLRTVQREAENGLAFAKKVRFSLMVDCFMMKLMLIRTIRGLEQGGGTLEVDRSFEKQLDVKQRPTIVVCLYWINKLQAQYFAQDFGAAMIAVAEAEKVLWSTGYLMEFAEFHFYAALTRAAACNTAMNEKRQLHLETLHSHSRQIALWAENCPKNFANRAALIDAEIARLEGRELEAMRLYEEAIRLARECSFIQNEGLGNELAGQFYAARGFKTIADAYLRNARSCYIRWGANAKVRQLEEAYPHLRKGIGLHQSDSTIETPLEHFDLQTVIKVSQAVSGEIVLEQLIQTLLVIALEHAGAERGLIIVPRGDNFRIEAEAITSLQGVRVRFRHADVTPADLPEGILHYVVRTQEPVLLDEATVPNQFSANTYMSHTQARSILCLPLLKQSKLIGVLYLENDLTARVFTASRVAVLQLLASQAAISLENAYLYADVRQTEAYLAAAQRLSHTGSFGWHPATGDIIWSEETYRILGYDRSTLPNLAAVLQRVHPDDVAFVQDSVQRALRGDTDFDFEHRLLMPGGAIKYVHVVGHVTRDEQGRVEYIGAIQDVTQRRLSEEALSQARSELVRVASVTSLGVLTASIAHELNQPLSGIVTNASTCLRMLAVDPPNIEGARETARRTIRDGNRASKVVTRLRALFSKKEITTEPVDLNDAAREVIALSLSELQRNRVILRTEFGDNLPPVAGDRVQLSRSSSTSSGTPRTR
jgi:PAS domain S-box-containing protein